MSWKLAELKWRQDLGLYESRWESNHGGQAGSLPLARKQAVEAFHKQHVVSPPRRTTDVVKRASKGFPEQQRASLGTPCLPSSDRTSAAFTTPPALRPSCNDSRLLNRPLSEQEHSSVLSSAVHGCNQAISSSQRAKRSHSCSELKHSSCLVVSYRETPSTPRFRKHNICSCSPDIVRVCESLQRSTSREELTRLLDHVDTPGNRSSEHHICNSFDFQNQEPEEDLTVFLDPGRASEQTKPFTEALLEIDRNTFRLVDGKRCPDVHDLDSTSDSSRTVFPSTLSQHRSDSTLLPRDTMPRFIRLPNAGDEQSTQPQPANDSSTSEPAPVPIRRTTPIYQEFGQAYTSITGDIASPRLTSPTPGTDSLNNVYASAMAESSSGSRPQQNSRSMNASQATSSAQPLVTETQRPAVVFPFQRGGSPDNDDHMRPIFGDNNPAGLLIGSDDVPLTPYPVLRDVRRGSAIPRSSPMPVPSTVAYESAEEFPSLRPSVTFQPQGSPHQMRSRDPVRRSRSPYPQARADDVADDESTGLNNTVASIYDRYGTADALVAPLPRATPFSTMTHNRLIGQDSETSSSSSSDQIGGPVLPITTALNAQDWPLPSSPAPPLPPNSSPVAASSRDGGVWSTSTGTYGSTRNLLNPTGLNMSANLPGTLHGNGAHLDANGLIHVVDALRFHQSVATNATTNEEDDAAWETTQGTNTQRNSAVRDGDSLAFSSSPGAQSVSLWDPLSTTRDRQVDDLDREFNQLRRYRLVNGNGLNEAAQNGNAQGYEATSSPQQSDRTTSSSTPISPILRPETLTIDSAIRQPSSPPRVRDSSIAGNHTPLTNRRNRITPSTLVEMSSDTAPGSASRYGTAGESDDAITPVANGHDHTENVAVWRESTHEDTIRSVNSDITRYDPDLLPRVRREFPEARLTIDRRIFAAEQNAAFVRRQRMLTWLLFVLAVLVWPFGGFALINSAEENGVAARAALLELSVRLGGEPVNNINERDVVLAGRLAVVGPFVWFGGFVVLVSVLIAALW